MLIPKQKKKEIVDNPLRPKIGVPRSHSVCRISWGEFHLEYDELVERLKVDADDNEKFIEAIQLEIPEEDRYRCQDREVYLIDPKWKKFVVDTAREIFDDVKVELRKW